MSAPIDRETLQERFAYWCGKLRLTPGRCAGEKSFNELYEGLNNLE